MDPTQHSDQTLTVQVVRRGQALAFQQLSSARKKLLKIGRWPASDIHVDDPLAARLHAVLEVNRFGVTLHDMGTGNPVVLNGRAVTGKARLTGRDEIRIGETLLHVTRGSAPQPTASGSPISARAAPSAPTAEPSSGASPLAAGGPAFLRTAAAPPPPPPVTAGAPPPAIASANAPMPTVASAGADRRGMSLAGRVAALPEAELLRVERLLERMALERGPAFASPRARREPPAPPAKEEEMYDTQVLVRQMKREQRFGRAAAGVGVLIVAALIIVPIALTLGDTTQSEATEAVRQARLRTPEPIASSGAQPESAAAAALPNRQAPLADVATPTSYDEYKVQRGDTPGRIARRTLGRADRWEAIFEANRDRLASPTSVEVGTRLRIPR